MIELSTQFLLYYLLLGTFTGFVAGLFGVGGGSVMVPILTSILTLQGVSDESVMHMALGTSMASIVGTSFASFRAHHKKGFVRWDIFKKMLPGILLGTLIATYIAKFLSTDTLALIFSFFILFATIQMLFNIKPKATRSIGGNKALFGAGSIIGAISALVSIGGGALSVPYLLWHNIDIKKAIGTSAAIGFPIAISGTIGYVINGSHRMDISEGVIGFIYLPAVVIISLTSYFTAPFGVKVAHRLSTVMLKKLFALLLLALCIKMLTSLF